MPSQRAREQQDAELLEASVDAARGAAAYIADQARRGTSFAFREKRRADFVTEVDTGAEALIRDSLLARVPDATVVGEELSPSARLDSHLTFIVDPLDGTTNFLHGYPVYAVSIAAVVDGELATGVVLDVPHGELFTARRGAGAFRDGERISVSKTDVPAHALVGTGFPFKDLEHLDHFQRQFARLMRESAGVRRAGSAALDLAAVACGRFDAFWELRLTPWDIAAGLIVVREAGGKVTDLRGVDLVPSHSAVVASNGVLHSWLLDALQ